MSDLVERLRESVRACRALDRSALLAEAADEIERLRKRWPGRCERQMMGRFSDSPERILARGIDELLRRTK